MKCPFCGHTDSRVLDSRAVSESAVIRRRRQCGLCSKRFTTMEKPEEEPIVVIKRDGRRELFDGNKLLRGLILAGQKRNVPLDTWQGVVESLEQELRSTYIREVTADQIGALALNRLREIDDVAYVRFASVFRQFPDIETFKSELETLLELRRREQKN